MSNTVTLFKVFEPGDEKGTYLSPFTPEPIRVIYKRGEKSFPHPVMRELGFPLFAFRSWDIADKFRYYVAPFTSVWYVEAKVIDLPDFKFLSYKQLEYLAKLIEANAPLRVLKEYLAELEKYDLYPPPDRFDRDTVFCEWIKPIRAVGISVDWGGRL